MLWFGNDLVPHLRPTRPTPYAELMRAKWAIGAPELGLWAGRVTDRAGRDVDARTAIGVDLERKLLFLAVAERASPRIMMQTLAGLGAREGMLLDGGDASSMVIGKGAQGVPPGAAMSAWRPTATQFGIKAKPLAADASADRPARLSLLHAGTSLGGGN
jgi:hypothetical protein